jgi:hypothetical protein
LTFKKDKKTAEGTNNVEMNVEGNAGEDNSEAVEKTSKKDKKPKIKKQKLDALDYEREFNPRHKTHIEEDDFFIVDE